MELNSSVGSVSQIMNWFSLLVVFVERMWCLWYIQFRKINEKIGKMMLKMVSMVWWVDWCWRWEQILWSCFCFVKV